MNTKIGPVLEVANCCLHGKYGVEIRIMSMNKDNSHSWVRISHGMNMLVTNLNDKDQDDNEQEASVQFEEHALKLNASDFACRSKAKAKLQRRDSASSSTRTIPFGERTWTDVEPGEYSISDYAVSKKLIHLLRHKNLHPDKTMERLNSGESKERSSERYFLYCTLNIGLMTASGRVAMAKGGGKKKRFQYCIGFASGQEILVFSSSSRSFRTQSH